MKILSLGHSSFLLAMRPSPDAEPVRILADPWLSDFSVGDLMGRYPRVRFHPGDLPEVHAVYLSHGHTDHLDPESLLRLHRDLPGRPALLLPESIEFLLPLLTRHLPNWRPLVLRALETVELRGLALTGYFNPAPGVTNEDDVMLLHARSPEERFLSECDAMLPLADPDVEAEIAELLLGGDPRTACFLTTRNELDVTMSVLAARDPEDRSRRVAASHDATGAEILDLYAAGEGGLWSDPRLVRIVGGQGLCYPQALDPDRNRVLFPIRIEDRVRLERQIARSCDCRHRIEELRAGEWHIVGPGGELSREKADFLELLDREADRVFEPERRLFDDFPVAPLRRDRRDRAEREDRILALLNDRFRPYLLSNVALPARDLFGREGGGYRIRVLYGTTGSSTEEADYRIGFDVLAFEEVPVEGEPDEVLWANDLLDFLDGKCDEFSLFCRRSPGGWSQLLWRSLGLPFPNRDIVEKKVALHFERVAGGETNRDWVLPFYDAGP